MLLFLMFIFSVACNAFAIPTQKHVQLIASQEVNIHKQMVRHMIASSLLAAFTIACFNVVKSKCVKKMKLKKKDDDFWIVYEMII